MEQDPNKNQNVGKLAKLLAQKEAEEAKLRELEKGTPVKQTLNLAVGDEISFNLLKFKIVELPNVKNGNRYVYLSKKSDGSDAVALRSFSINEVENMLKNGAINLTNPQEKTVEETPIEKPEDATFLSMSPQSSYADKAEFMRARDEAMGNIPESVDFLNANIDTAPQKVESFAKEPDIKYPRPDSASMFCPFCGVKQNLEAVFCANCGEKIPSIKKPKEEPKDNHDKRWTVRPLKRMPILTEDERNKILAEDAKKWEEGTNQEKNFQTIEGIEPSQIQELSVEEVEKIFQKMEIHGDAFNGERLTPEILKKEGLLPKYKVDTEEGVIWFSSSGYNLGKNRVAIMAYVEKNNKTVARSYYRSNSQGVWRYLPSYLEMDGQINWYSKGYGEESINLPTNIQRALAEITKDEKSILKVENPELVFAGTSRGLINAMNGTYMNETESESIKLGDFSVEEKDKKIDPEKIKLSKDQSPNLDPEKVIYRWKQNSNIYGEIEMEAVPSQDGKLIFTFCKDKLNRVWIGNIENDSEIQSTGLKKEWINPEDLGTPAFEYKTGDTDQTGGYGNDGLRNGPYVDMFENYLSKVPVIREYCESRNIPLPVLIAAAEKTNQKTEDQAVEGKSIFCPNCGKEQTAEAGFCGSCGKKIPKMEDIVVKTEKSEEPLDVCPKCGHSQKSKESFCGVCGSPMVAPKNPEQAELLVALGEARMKYVAAYKKFKESAGILVRAKRFIFGTKIAEKNVPPELKKLEEEYDNAAAALGKQMYSEKISELKTDTTLTNEEKTAELLRYKQNEIFNKVIVEEQTMLAALKTENLPPKERGIAKKALDWYISQPTWKKVAMATVFSAAFFALVAPGSVAAAGGMGAFVGIRAARGVAGSFLSQAAVKSYDWLFKDKSAEKRIEAEAELSKLCGYTNADEIAEGKKRYAKIAEQEQKTKRRRAVKKIAVGAVAGGIASVGVGYGAGKIISSGINAQTGNGLNPDKSATPNTSGGKTSPNNTGPLNNKNTAPIDSKNGDGANSTNQPNTPKPKIEKNIDNTIVHKGQGIEHAFIKQIESDPKLAQDLGFKGDVNDAKALHKFAQNEAHRIALENKKANLKISEADKASYKITGVDNKGKAIIEEGEGNKKYEYVEKKNIKTPEQHKIKTTHTPKHVENVKIPKGSNPIDLNPSDLSDSKPGDKTFVKPGDKLPADQTELKTETTIKEQAPAVVTDAPATDAKPTTSPKPSPTPEEISKEIKTQIELTEKYPQFKGTTFAKNTLNIPEEKLVETYKVYEENIKQITKGNSVENFKSKVGGSPANNYIDAKSVEGDLVTPYVNEIAKLANEKPKFDLKNGHETLQNFIERCVLKLTKEGKLEEIKNLKIK